MMFCPFECMCTMCAPVCTMLCQCVPCVSLCTMCVPVCTCVHHVCVPVCAYVYHVCAWFLCTTEEGIRSPGTGLQTIVTCHVNYRTKPKTAHAFISLALVNAHCSPY